MIEALKTAAVCAAIMALLIVIDYGEDCQQGRQRAPWCDLMEGKP